jgi:hypothetical protein
MCTEDEHKLSYCVALHNGVEVNILKKPAPAGAVSSMPKLTPAPAPAHAPTTSATDMVMVDVYVASYPVEAMVDTGCSFPMSVPKAYADALVRIGLAARSRSAQSILADGSTHPVDMIVIKSITVDGRTLSNVEASVSSSDTAPILLGLGALNRLGSYTITDGRLVFTGEQPA